MNSTRIKNIRKQLKAGKFDALIITQAANVRFVTNFTGHDSWAVLTSRKIFLITDSRYTEQAIKQCPDCDIVERAGSLFDEVARILNRVKSVRTVAVEDKTAINVFNMLRKKLDAKVKPSGNIVEKVRQFKDDSEVKSIIKAGKIAISALKTTFSEIRPGVSEAQFAALLDYNIKMVNSSPGFETIVAFGANASQPHHQPGNRKLRTNDTILIDYGATHNGYTCDITRCFTIGKVSKQYIKAYQTVAAAQQAAINIIGPGVKVANVENAAREIIKQAGFPQYGHGTGHGLGLEVHELPVVSNRIKDAVLQPGQTITIEPGIYIPGKLGIRIEDDILVTKTGYKLLTPKELKGLNNPPTI